MWMERVRGGWKVRDEEREREQWAVSNHLEVWVESRVCDIYIACDNIVIVVLTMCDLTLSSILQKPFKTHLQRAHAFMEV